MVLALVWPLMFARAQGSSDALLGAGRTGPSWALIHEEIPDIAAGDGLGHDGQQFYVVARQPLDPAAGRDHLDWPAYRYRRILFPLVAGALAPGGGRALIAAFVLVSLAGVALGARALQKMDGSPWWLPLTMAAAPVTILSLPYSLSDAFGTGLALMAVALAGRRRWAAVLAFAVAAALTRESLVIVALGLALTPGMPRRWRIAVATVPSAAVAAWSLWSAGRMGVPVSEAGTAQLALPFTGWLSDATDPTSLVLGLLTLAVMATAAVRVRHRAPHVAAILGAQVLLLVCLSPLVAGDWYNSLRTATPMLPLAVWALTATPAVEEPDAPEPADTPAALVPA